MNSIGGNQGGFFPAPYVDRYGEHDVELDRGNPLKLNKAEYDKINRMWQQNDLQTYITKTQRTHRTALEMQWYLI